MLAGLRPRSLWRATPLHTLRLTPRRWQMTRAGMTFPYDIRPALDARGEVPSAPYDSSPLPGSVPEYTAHIVLHPADVARADTTWPSHIDSVSPLLSELNSWTKDNGSLAGYAINLSAGRGTLPAPAAAWDRHRASSARCPPNTSADDERFWLYAYRPSGQFVKWPEPLSLRTLPSGATLRAELERLWDEAPPSNEAHVYVCTHGMRDCRCGVVGTELVDALKRAVRQHEAQCIAENSMPAKKVHVWTISHVGGHKWAANALVYPHGDWYGNLRVSDAPLLLRAALAPASSRHDLQDLRERLVLWPRWRGRLGMKQLDQREHMAAWGPPIVYTAQVTPRARGPSATEATASTPAPSTSVRKVPLRFRTHEGAWHDVEGTIGETLMEVAKRYDLPTIEATCGGELECATCHAYLCASPAAAPDAPGDRQTPPESDGVPHPDHISDEEDDMLEYALSRQPTSRLLCQVPVTQALSDWMTQRGGRVELGRY